MKLPFSERMYQLFKSSITKESGFHRTTRMYPIELPEQLFSGVKREYGEQHASVIFNACMKLGIEALINAHKEKYEK